MTVHELQGALAPPSLRNNGYDRNSSDPNASWGLGYSDFAAAVPLLALEVTALALGVWSWLHSDTLLEWVRHNQIGKGAFAEPPTTLALACFGGAALVCLLVVACLPSLRALVHLMARRAAPLILLAFFPTLFNWRLWVDREMPHLLYAFTVVGLTKWLVRYSFDAPALGDCVPRSWMGFVRSARNILRDWACVWRALPRQLPLVVVLVACAIYTAFFSYHTIVHHRNALSSSLDLGLEDNLVWNVLHRAPLFKSSPLGGPHSSHLGFHATWFSFVIAPFYALRPNAETLLIVQAFLFGSAALPLYLFGQRLVSKWLACLIALAYVLYPGLHGSNLYDFHYLPLGPFFLWFTIYFADKRRWTLMLVFALLSLSVREDVAAGLAGLGGLILLSGRRPVAGAVLLILGAAYFVFMKGVVMHHAMGGGDAFVHQYRLLIPEDDNTFVGVVKTIMSNPIFTLETLLERQKLIYLVEIMLPLAFVPLLRPLGLWASAVGFVFTLLSTKYQPQIMISFQYTAYWTAQLFPATLFNFRWMDRVAAINERRGIAWKWSWVAALAVGTAAMSYQYGALIQHNTAWGGFGPYHFGTDATDLKRRADLRPLLALIPPTAKVVACENVVPQLSNRPDAYTLRLSVYDADYILFHLPAPQFERENVLDALQSRRFGIVKESGEYVLAKRGFSTSENLRIIGRLGGHGFN
jgi:uncharacterized membrane protein